LVNGPAYPLFLFPLFFFFLLSSSAEAGRGISERTISVTREKVGLPVSVSPFFFFPSSPLFPDSFLSLGRDWSIIYLRGTYPSQKRSDCSLLFFFLFPSLMSLSFLSRSFIGNQ